MTTLSLAAIRSVRVALKARWTMAALCSAMPLTRDQVVEVIDACRRNQNDEDALRRVNDVLWWQANGKPLINGQLANWSWYHAHTVFKLPAPLA